jgi:uncharacterized protein YuzE
MMKTSYDPEADAFAAWFAPEGIKSDRSEEVAPGVFVDFDASGNAIGIEVLSVRRRLAGAYPGAAEKSVAAEPL